MKSTKTPRFVLLPYLALGKRWIGPALWLIPAGILLGWSVAQTARLEQRYPFLGFIISGVGLVIVIYTFLARRAHVSCHKSNFVIHTPFYPIAFSYQRIEMVRPTEFKSIFPPENEKNSRWRLYKNIWGKTVIVINVKGYPFPKWWLRLWFHPYLMHPRETALVLPVEDWMGLSRSLEALRSNWLEGQRQRRRK